MYAVFKSGGKQYEARPGHVVRVEKLPGEVGDSIVLGEVLLFSDGEQVRIGRPVVEGVTIRGNIIEHGKNRKIVIYKYKRRKDYSRKQGHRQQFTAVRVEQIALG